jgi:hypothetical protein
MMMTTMVPPDLPADPAALRSAIASMMTPAWESAWQERLRDARYADLASVRRTSAEMLELAAARFDAGDEIGFRSWCRFIIDHAAGERWDESRKAA